MAESVPEKPLDHYEPPAGMPSEAQVSASAAWLASRDPKHLLERLGVIGGYHRAAIQEAAVMIVELEAGQQLANQQVSPKGLE